MLNLDFSRARKISIYPEEELFVEDGLYCGGKIKNIECKLSPTLPGTIAINFDIYDMVDDSKKLRTIRLTHFGSFTVEW